MTSPNDTLGKPLFRFAVISDTHVNPDEDSCNSPFPVNAKANRRFRFVVADLNRRDPDFVIHLGDLVHPVPETGELYGQAAQAYRDILADLKAPIWHVPGNHDIGDTPIGGAPASPTTDAMIEAWTQEFGAQFQSFTHGDVQFILLNAQLINSGLRDEEKQKDWFEGELAKGGKRKIVCLHHPAYLFQPDEPVHYDNTNPPGRQWLLGLIEKHGIEALFSGHAHNFWYDRYKTTDYYLAPSTCFIRQDYSEMFRAIPPQNSEFGRDDCDKLGYLMVSVYENGHTVQFVRTFGAELKPDEEPAQLRELAPAPRENSASLIGFDLRQNWAEVSEVPPSGGLDEFDRKMVRNDYPLLALIEMGVRNLRIPLADLRDPMRKERLKALHHLGFHLTLFGFDIPARQDLELIRDCRDYLADWEMTLDWPELANRLDDIARVHQQTQLPVYISRMRSKSDLPSGSIYFHVINHGFTPNDREQIELLASHRKCGIEGAIFRLDNQLPTSQTLLDIDNLVGSVGLAASVHLRLAGANPALAHIDYEESCERVSQALETVANLKKTRVFCDTLVDHDRGYFVRQGAIDRCANPNKMLEIIRKAHFEQHQRNQGAK